MLPTAGQRTHWRVLGSNALVCAQGQGGQEKTGGEAATYRGGRVLRLCRLVLERGKVPEFFLPNSNSNVGFIVVNLSVRGAEI